ncbi:hypothetical protein B0H17DRAFT_904472, partial [Mycena rosella]
RVEELWFEDGNIVIQAGNSQFRLYRGILAARSPVFQDMLSFPQPSDSELVEGCPLVRLPDVAIEVTAFLKAIFAPPCSSTYRASHRSPRYFPPFPARTSFEIIAGCLRLSHKYEVDYLRRRALIHLSSRYRTTLSEYDSSKGPNPERAPSKTVSFNRPNGLHRVLSTEIFHGATYNGVPTRLCIEDQTEFLHGHVNHTRAATVITRFLYDPREIDECRSPARCLEVRANATTANQDTISTFSHIPLRVWDADDWESLSALCIPCLSVLQDTHAGARAEFWDGLPSMYGLLPWEELEKM